MAMAMAIIARWRMPPENSCGKESRARRGVGDADQVEEFGGPGTGCRPVQLLVHPDRLDDLVADPVDRGEGGERVLEDHRHLVAAQAREFTAGQSDQFAAFEAYGALDPCGTRQQAEHGQRGHRLAGAGLADDPEGLPATQRQVDAPDRRLRTEVDGEVGDFEQRGGHWELREVGSRASRRPSPIRLTARTKRTSRAAAK
ncbi:hypothetical protein GCM10020229_41860 [Kitasatospora albolonga]